MDRVAINKHVLRAYEFAVKECMSNELLPIRIVKSGITASLPEQSLLSQRALYNTSQTSDVSLFMRQLNMGTRGHRKRYPSFVKPSLSIRSC